MRFEARDLKPYAVTVPVADLVEGTLYFSVQFLDGDALVPVLDPLVYIGRDLRPGDAGVVYLQDFESYVGGVRFPDGGGGVRRARYRTSPADRMINLHDFESALDELLGCSLRRRGVATT